MNTKMAPGSATSTAKICHQLQQSKILNYEEMLAEGYRRFMGHGMVAIDVGAHLGLHYSKLKNLVGPTGRVIGYEAVPEFGEHIVERHMGDAEIVQKALSDEPGVGKFLHMVGAPGESGFKERTYQSEYGDRGAREIEVEITTLDSELPNLDRCDFIKVDIEGCELKALNGGLDLIRRTRPIISIEYGKPTYSLYELTSNSLWDWTERTEYLISDLFGNVLKDRKEWNEVCDSAYWDYFLVPIEKRQFWIDLFSQEPATIIEHV